MPKTRKERVDRDLILLRSLLKQKNEVTPQEVAYFREHPDEIDEITAPVNIHKMFLVAGSVLGILLVIGANLLEHLSVTPLFGATVREIVSEITFEIGVALIGSGVTAYMLGILLNVQQENAQEWRRAIREKISSTGS